ncbi:MAG: hydrogenase maturation nickel metallochaperone HypA [Planctomycetota bacterium]
MHESQIAKKVLDVVLQRADGDRATRVRGVCGWVAETESLSTNSLAFHFDAHAKGTIAEGARLELKLTVVYAKCQDCDTRFAPDHHVTICPSCSSQNAILLSPTGLGVDSIDVE